MQKNGGEMPHNGGGLASTEEKWKKPQRNGTQPRRVALRAGKMRFALENCIPP